VELAHRALSRRLALRPSSPHRPVESKSSETLYTAPAGIGRGQEAPTGSYRVKAMVGTAHTVGGTLVSRLLRVVSEETHPNPFKAP